MPDKVNVLLIGGGGREHAIALKLTQSPRLGKLWLTHAENPGLAALGTAVDVPVSIREIYRLQQFCEKNDIGLVVIGPEDPLAEGYADKLAAPGRAVFGPLAAGARLEADKAWCKQLLRAGSIPTAEARIFSDPDTAKQYIESRVLEEPEIARLLGYVEPIRDPARRRQALDATMRIAIATAEKRAPIAADVTIIRDSNVFRSMAGDQTAIAAELLAIGKAYKARHDDLPVVKAAGLAKGKGVIIPSTLAEAVGAVDKIMVQKAFGIAGKQVVVEERLEGPEVSVLAIVDGRNILVLPPCQDHKRLGDGDVGPNTGGMGAFCPSDTINEEMMARIEREILVPTIDTLRREGIEYRGVLYAGLMLTPAGPKVLEYNCRFGDPECQPLMSRLKSDLIDLLMHTCTGTLDECEVEWSDEHACCVVLASAGYPEKPRLDVPISGLDKACAVTGVTVYHAGTRRNAKGEVVTAGGRVLGVTGVGATLAEARKRAYKACDLIQFDGKTLRRDIAAAVPAARA